jgi:hypothetical protein
MNVQIQTHPDAKPNYAIGATVALTCLAVDVVEGGEDENYTWYINGDTVLSGPTVNDGAYSHTVAEADFGGIIQCEVNGHWSNGVSLLPLEPMNPTMFSRIPAPYSYLATGTATLAFAGAGTNMTYEVLDPAGGSVETGSCDNGEVIVHTTGSDPAEGLYTVNLSGDGGTASISVEIRAFAIDEELLLWGRKQWVGSNDPTGTRVYQSGYNDIGGFQQFGQIERNPWLIQQFTGDNEGNVIMRLVNWAELTGAPATQEVSIDGLFHTVLTWVGTASVDGVYTSVDHEFARHMQGTPEFSFTSTESMVLNFKAKPSYEVTISDIGLGAYDADYVFGYSPDFGTGSGTVGSSGALESLFVDHPEGQTTTRIRAKFVDGSNVFSQFSMQVYLQETGDSCYLRMDPDTNEAGTGTDTNWYHGECDTNSGLMDNISAALMQIKDSADNPVSYVGATTSTFVIDETTGAADPGIITSIDVDVGGSGYVTPPVVTIGSSGAGTSAAATAILTDGVVTSVTVDDGGTLYAAGTTTVTFAAPVGVPTTATFDVRIFN